MVSPEGLAERSAAGRADRLSRLVGALFSTMPIGPLVYFRIFFGATLIWHISSYFLGDTDRIAELYIEPQFHFTYYGFGWVEPWPGDGMYWHFAGLLLCAACMTLGLFYRVATALFFLGYSYVFLIDETYYINHFYLKCLLSGIMIFVPAHRHLSLDALLRPGIRSLEAPAWPLWLLRAQIGLVYFYAGVAKLNHDWLSGRVMGIWLEQNRDLPVVGPYLSENWVVLLFTYGGVSLDLFVAPLLLWRRTRIPAFAFAVSFHLMNSVLFPIATFPWMMIVSTVLFLDPSWFSVFGAPETTRSSRDRTRAALTTQNWVTTGALAVYLAIQVALPLRHFLYPGNVLWTYEGMRFSWNVMQRAMSPVGVPSFDARNAEGRRLWPPENPLTPLQQTLMATHPDMILQCSHYIAEQLRERGHESVRVYANVSVSLNGRPPQPYVDPRVDLAAQPRDLRPIDWILPLRQIQGD